MPTHDLDVAGWIFVRRTDLGSDRWLGRTSFSLVAAFAFGLSLGLFVHLAFLLQECVAVLCDVDLLVVLQVWVFSATGL